MKTVLLSAAFLLSFSFLSNAQVDCEYALTCPPELTLSCTEDSSPEALGLPEIISNCGNEELIITHNDVESGDDCNRIIQRTFSLSLGDETLATCEQLIEVIDDVPPYFPNLPQDLVIECGGELPEAPECPAVDDCSDIVSCETFEVQTGSPVDSCVMTLADGPGPEWAVWLPGLPIEDPHFVWDGDGEMVTYFNGTVHITGLVRNSTDPGQAYEVDMWLENERDWDEWSALGRFYKDDYNLAGNNYLNWSYYEMVNVFSRLVGQDDLEGDVLELYHMPSDFFFGFQRGVAANNRNSNDGISGWFTFEGTYYGEEVEGHGDLAADLSCTPVDDDGDGGECNDGGYTVYWRATDACGNSATASQSVASQDNEAPEFTEFPEDVTIACNDLPYESEMPVAEDSCPGEVTIEGPFDETIAGECPTAYIIERSWDAIDICGNTETRTQLIFVTDEEAPVFGDVAEVLEISCAGEAELITAEATDDCNEITVTFTDEPLEGEEFCEGSVERTYTATDICGNTSTFTQQLIVNDDEAPVILNAPAEAIELSCEDYEGFELELGFTDNCPETEFFFEQSIEEGDCASSFTVNRTYFAVDGCGNTATAEVLIIVSDNEAPQLIGVPGDVSLSCNDDIPDALVSAFDNCDPNPTVSLTATTDELECGSLFIRTWTAIDACGNENSATQTITFIDEEGPLFVNFPQDVIVECSSELPEAEVEVEDECSEVVSLDLEENIIEGDCPAEYTLIRTWTAVDGCGNSSIASQTIEVVDTEGPIFNDFPASIEVSCDFSFPEDFGVSAEDACGEVSLEFSDNTEVYLCDNTYERTWVATDDCGNSTTVVQELVVVDDEAPVVLSFPEDVTIECSDYDPEAEPQIEVIDNCDNELDLEISDLIEEGDCPNSFTRTRTYTWTDDCGNGTSRTYVVNVEDNTAPTLLGVPADETIGCLDPIPDAIVFATDNCSEGLEVALTAETEELECGFLFIRTWSTVDECGNEASATQTITVIDDTDPFFDFLPDDIFLSCGDSIPPVADVQVLDECDDEPILFVAEEWEGGEGECPSTLIRIYRGADCAGNFVIYAQYIYFEEDEEDGNNGGDGPGIVEDPVEGFEMALSRTDMEEYFIDLSSSSDHRVNIEVLNLGGSVVDKIAEMPMNANEKYRVNYNTSYLTPGIYIVRVYSDTINESRKIAVMR